MRRRGSRMCASNGGPVASDVPARPGHLPTDARFVAAPAPHWRHGAEEPGSGQPVGLHTSWTVHGEPLRYEQYDARGQLLWRRSPHSPEPLVTLAADFRDEPRWYDWYQWVGRYHDAMHAAVARVASEGSSAKRRELAHALTFLDQRRGRSRALTFPRHDRVLELFHAHAPIEEVSLADPETRTFTAFALDAMIATGDDTSLRTWAPRWLAAAGAEEPRPRDHVPPGLRDRVRRALAGIPDDDPVVRAGRKIGRCVLPVLGRPGKTAALLVDHEETSYWLAGETVERAPLVIDATGPSLAPSFATVGALTARTCIAERGRGVWLAQRYGEGLYLFGAARTESAFAIETVVDLFVRCSDAAWIDRVAALFDEVRPFAGSAQDGLGDAEGPWIREYSADRDHVHARDRRYLGVRGTEFVTAQVQVATRSSLVAREPRRRPLPTLTVAHRGADRAEAVAAFEAAERGLLGRGYFLAAVTPLPAPA